MKRIRGRLMAWGAGLLLLGATAAPAAAAVVSIPGGGCPATLNGNTSYRLDGNITQGGGTGACLSINGNGTTIDLNGYSISGQGANGADGSGIESSLINANTGFASNGNNVTILGPGTIHHFAFCIRLGNHALIQNVLAHDCQPSFDDPNGTPIGLGGITLGPWSKCVECRVHNVSVSDPSEGAWCIYMGYGCLLESSIVETSDNGAYVGSDCKVWDLVVDSVTKIGARVQAGTEVARTVISHCHDGPGIYYDCNVGGGGPAVTTKACQDSSNSVWCPGGNVPVAGAGGIFINSGNVVTDCATNNDGVKFPGNTAQCT